MYRIIAWLLLKDIQNYQFSLIYRFSGGGKQLAKFPHLGRLLILHRAGGETHSNQLGLEGASRNG